MVSDLADASGYDLPRKTTLAQRQRAHVGVRPPLVDSTAASHFIAHDRVA